MNPLQAVLAAARAGDYSFTTVTPETHRRVLARREGEAAKDLRDVFGWSMPFERELLPADLWEPLEAADMVEDAGSGLWRSRLRISSAAETLFLHSAFPTEDADSVFFGPDSYRFIAFLEAELPALGARRGLVDIGSGSGVGGIAVARLLPDARLTLADINAFALRLARANAAAAGLEAEVIESAGLECVPDGFDLVIANPPFVMDEGGRTYRDGGDMHGLRLSLDWAEEAMRRLPQGGAMLLYTGSAIVSGRDGFRAALADSAAARGFSLRYAELDPDIFGELLDEPAYRDVERIAAVGAVLVKG
ncbi:MAG TPA: methyltransferase [Allosphingosinicella sp.]